MGNQICCAAEDAGGSGVTPPWDPAWDGEYEDFEEKDDSVRTIMVPCAAGSLVAAVMQMQTEGGQARASASGTAPAGTTAGPGQRFNLVLAPGRHVIDKQITLRRHVHIIPEKGPGTVHVVGLSMPAAEPGQPEVDETPRLLVSRGGTVELHKLIIEKLGLCNEGDLTLKGCKVFNFRPSGPAARGLETLGQSVLCAGPKAQTTLIACEFSKNESCGGGGAVLTNGKMGAEDCRFLHNVAWGKAGGGAICAPLSVMRSSTQGITLTNCEFSHNAAEGGNGGAIACNNHLEATSTIFKENSAGAGGAVFFYAMDKEQAEQAEFGIGSRRGDPGRFKLTGCEFLDNRAKTTGGAVHIDSKIGPLCNLAACKFLRNKDSNTAFAGNNAIEWEEHTEKPSFKNELLHLIDLNVD